MIVEILVVGPMQTNCYVVGCEISREALVIDPGAESERIQETLKENGLRVNTIVLTHAHADHSGAAGELKKATGAKLVLHRDDAPVLADPHLNLAAYFDPAIVFPTPDGLLADGDRVECGTIGLEVLHTPGHTPGCICLLGEGVLFSGDTLFAGSIGRNDLPGGNFKDLIASLKNRLMPLPDATRVYPGHGPDSVMGFEKRENPYLTTEW